MTPPTIRHGEVFVPPPRERARFLRPVSILGRWTDALGFPEAGRDPSAFVNADWDPSCRLAVVRYLETGFMYTEAMWAEQCRMGCGKSLFAAQYFTDGQYAWTGALSHYVRHHHLRPPDRFTDHVLRPYALPATIRNHLLRLGAQLGIGLLVSDAWWLDEDGWAVHGQGTIG
jgi:hypothetical protein